MKPTGQRWHLRNQHELNAFTEWLELEWQAHRKPTVQILGEDRTENQNKMFYGLYNDIARNMDEKGIIDVKRECKLHYGVPILRGADPKYCDWYDQSVKPLDYELKLRLMDHMDVTSMFTKAQATEYIDTMLREYGQQGVFIPDPRRGEQ